MFTLPYRTLIHKKRWATNGLNGALADQLDRLVPDERTIVLRPLDHIQTIDEVFRHNLRAQPYGHHAPFG